MAAELPGAAPARGEDIRPPLGTWGCLYAVVLGALVMEISVLWLVARAFE
jgi:hypothetical protein